MECGVSWDELDLELAEMFDEYTWRADDVQESLDQWGQWHAARIREKAASPQNRARQREYRKSEWRRAVERSASRTWRKSNEQRVREYELSESRRLAVSKNSKEWKSANRARVLEQQRRYREKNAARLSEYAKRRYAERKAA
jgi:hypothetical protein